MSLVDDFLTMLQAAENAGSLTLDKMMDLILAKTRRHTAAEAGSIFVVEGDQLKACSMQNDRIQMDFSIFHMPLNPQSIAGYVATTGEIVEVDDLYNLDRDLPYQFNRTFDDKARYRSTSMLAFPLKNFSGEVIGVVQLLNHITGVDDFGVPRYGPFPGYYADDVRSLAVMLGLLVERASLLQEIARLKS